MIVKRGAFVLLVVLSLLLVLTPSILGEPAELILLGESHRLSFSEPTSVRVETPTTTFRQDEITTFLFTPQEEGNHALFVASENTSRAFHVVRPSFEPHRSSIRVGEPVVWTYFVPSGGESFYLDVPEVVSNVSLFHRSEGPVNFSLLTPRRLFSDSPSLKQLYVPASSPGVVEIRYTTPAPSLVERNISLLEKEVVVSADDLLDYHNVTSISLLPREVSDPSRVQVYWEEGNRDLPFVLHDEDNNSLYETLEWVVPHLSTQTFRIIVISSAAHLDEDRTFLADLTSLVATRDGLFTSAIPVGHFIRVTFEELLTSVNDITVFAMTNNSSTEATIEVYEEDGTEVLATIGPITEPDFYQIFLEGLVGSSDTFDLRIVGAPLLFDLIIDPIPLNNALVAQIYQTGPSDTVDSGASIQFDQETTVHANFSFSPTSTDLQFLEPGLHKISYGCLYRETGTSNRRIVTAWVAENGNELHPSRTYCYIRRTTDDSDRCSTQAVFLANISSGSNVTLEVNTVGAGTGTGIITEDSCWMYAEKVNRPVAQVAELSNYDDELDATVQFNQDFDEITYEDSATFTSDLANRWISVDEDGWYKIYYGATSEMITFTDDNDRKNVASYLYLNDATPLPASETYSYHKRVDDSLFSSENGFTLANLSAGDNISVRRYLIVDQDNGEVSQTRNESWLFMEKMDDDNILFLYDTNGGQASSSDGSFDQDITWEVQGVVGSDYSHTINSATFSILDDGLYEISYAVGWDDGGNGNRLIGCGRVSQDGNPVEPSTQCEYTRGNGYGRYGTAAANILVNNTAGSNYTVQWSGESHSESLEPGASWVTVIPVKLVDIFPPEITIDSPLSQTYLTSTIVFNLTANENLSSAQYTVDSGDTNVSMSTTNNVYFNVTSALADGVYTAEFYAVDLFGNINDSESVSFTVDTLSPSVLLDEPQNTTYTYTNLSLNFSASDLASSVDTCLYSLDSGDTNETLLNCENTTFLASQGSTTLSLYVNDTNGYLNNSESVTFFVDSIFPLIDFSFGVENDAVNLSQDYVFVNVSVTEANEANLTFFLYNSSFDLVSNVTYTDSTRNHTFTSLPDGVYYYNVTIVDVLGQSNTTATKNLSLDTTFPLVGYISPTEPNNTGFNRDSIYLNVSVTEDHEFNISFELYNESGLFRNFTSETGVHFRNFTFLPEGTYTYNVTVTDYSGNSNVTETRTQTLDRTTPLISFASGLESDGVNLSQDFIFVNVSVTDAYEENITFFLYNSSGDFIALANYSDGTHNHTFTSLSSGDYFYNVTVTDIASLSNSTTTKFLRLDNENPQAVPLIGTPDWWDGSWHYRKVLHIDESVDSELTNYPMKITILYGSGTDANFTMYTDGLSKTDFSDIRFTNAGGIPLDYYLIQKIDSDRAVFYVEVDTIDADDGADIYVYFDNSNANSASNGTATFDEFESHDSAASSSIDTAGGTDITFIDTATSKEGAGAVRTNDGSDTYRTKMQNDNTYDIDDYVAEGWLYIDSGATGNDQFGPGIHVAGTLGTNNGYEAIIDFRTSQSPQVRENTDNTGRTNGAYQIALGTWYLVNIYRAEGTNVSAELWTENQVYGPSPQTTTVRPSEVTHNSGYTGVFTYSNDASHVDAVWVRKRTANEPTYSGWLGLEEYTAGSLPNGSYTTDTQQNLSVNVSDNLELVNTTLYVFNSTGTLLYEATEVLIGSTNALVGFVYTFLYDGIFTWFYAATDTAGNTNTTANQTLTIDTTTALIEFVTPTPLDDESRSEDSLFINVSVTEDNEANITFFLYNASFDVVNETTYSNGTHSINITGISEGIYYYNVTLTDLANNVNTSVIRTITLDSVPPLLTLLSPPQETYTTSAQHNFSVSLSDGRGLFNTTFYLYNSTGFVVDESTTLLSSATTAEIGSVFFFVQEGNYTWFYVATDDAGNTNFSENRSIVYDITPPLLTFGPGTAPDLSARSQDFLFINMTVIELAEENITFSIYNSTFGLINETTYTNATHSLTLTSLPEGEYFYNVTIGDHVGFTNVSTTRSLTLDVTNPSAILLSPPNETFLSSSQQNFSVNLSDSVGLQNTTLFIINSTGSTLLSSPTSLGGIAQKEQGKIYSFLQEGTYTWFYRTYDRAVNENTTEVRTITYDLTNPLISYGPGVAVSGANLSQSFIFVNVSVTEANEANITFSLYNSSYSLVSNATYYTAVRNHTFTSVPDGVYYYNVTITDSSNRHNTTSSRRIALDTTFPVVSFGSGVENNGTNFSRDSLFVNVSVTELNERRTSFSLYLPNGALVNQTNFSDGTHLLNFTSLSDGKYDYNVTVYDYAGNTNSTTTRSLWLDRTGPATILYSPESKSYGFNTSLPLNFSVSDAIVEVDSCWYNLDETANTTISCSQVEYFNATEGGHVLYFYTNDSLSNLQTTTVVFSVQTTGPAVTLTAPFNDTFYNTTDPIILNFSVVGPLGISNCSLYGNWSGGWHENETKRQDSWWNASWNYRERLNISAQSEVTDDYTVDIAFDTTGSRFLDSGDDIRIVFYNGSDYIELDRLLVLPNASGTRVQFRLQRNISANDSDGDYFFYHGNPSAGSPPDNATNVWYFYDDFSSGTLDQWTYSSGTNVINAGVSNPWTGGTGVLEMGGACGSAFLKVNETYFPPTRDLKLRALWLDNPGLACGSDPFSGSPDADGILGLRGSSSTTYDGILVERDTDGADGIQYDVGATGNVIGYFSPFDVWQWTENYAYGTTASGHSAKVWNFTEAEPEYPQLNATSVSWTTPGLPFLRVASGTAQIAVVFGSILVENEPVVTTQEEEFIGDFVVNLSSDDSYQWNVQCYDRFDQGAYAFNNLTFSIDTLVPEIDFTTGTPVEGENLSENSFFVNVSITEKNVGNVTFSLYNGSDDLVNETLLGPGNTSLTFYNLLGGVYTYNVTVLDKALWTNVTPTRSLYLDAVPPTLELLGPLNASYQSNATQNFTANITDNLNLQNATLYVFNSTGALIYEATQVLVGTASVVVGLVYDFLSDGVFTWFYQAFDVVGNSDLSENRTVIIDTTFPLVSFGEGTAPDLTNTAEDFVYVNVTAIELYEANITFSLYDDGFTLIRQDFFTTGNRTVNWTLLSEGVYYYNVTVVDLAGNVNTTPSRQINLDTNSPSLSLLAPANNSYQNNLTQNFSAIFSDSVSLANATLFVYNSSQDLAYNETIPLSGATDEAGILSTLPSEGTYTWFYLVSDGVGNTNQSHNFTVILDVIPPLVSFGAGTFPNSSNLSQDFVYLNVSVTETNEANITFSLYDSDDALSRSFFSPLPNRSVQWTSLSEGRYYANVSVSDLAGNVNTTQTRTLVLDTTAPSIDLLSPINATYSTNLTQNFSGNSSDAFPMQNITLHIYNSSQDLVFSNTAPCACSPVGDHFEDNFSQLYTFSSGGTYVWFYEVFDYSGNRGFSENRTIILDTVFPTIEFVDPTPVPHANLSQNFLFVNVSVVEPYEANITFSLYDSAFSIVRQDFFVTGNRTVNWTFLPEDVYTYNITISDLSGNENTSETRTITLDQTGPTSGQLSPENDTSTSNLTQNFSMNVSDNLQLDNATLFVYNSTGSLVYEATEVLVGTTSTVVSLIYNFLSEGVFTWFYQIFDTSGNEEITENRTITLDNSTPTLSQFSFYALNSSQDVIGDETAFTSSNLLAIEYVLFNFTVQDNFGLSDNFTFYFTANGTNACSLGNLQSDTCYSYPDFVEFKNGTATSTFDATEMGSGDSLTCTYVGDQYERNYSCILDEHYNPNVWKYYPLEFDDVQWPTHPSQVLRRGNVVRITLNENIIPLDADQYKLDFRVNYTGSITEPLDTYFCNSTYSSGSPQNNSNCLLVAQKFPSELQDDGTKYRAYFTSAIFDSLGDIQYALLETEEVVGEYRLKIFDPVGIPSERTHVSSNYGETYISFSGDYESDFNINWFSDDSVSSATQAIYKLALEDLAQNIVNTSEVLYTWNITSLTSAPRVDLSYPLPLANLSQSTRVNWSATDVEGDAFGINISLFNETDTIYLIQNLSSSLSGALVNLSSISEGIYSLVVEACEESTPELLCGNETYSITVDNAAPLVTIDSPQNVTYATVSLDLNFSVLELTTLVEACWYSDDFGVTNTTIVNCENTTYAASETQTTLFVYAEDTLGNIGSDNVTFVADSLHPQIFFIPPTPENATWYNQTNLTLNVSLVEGNLINLTYLLVNETGGENSTVYLTNITEHVFTGLVSGNYTFNASAYDVLSNFNVTQTREIYVDIISPNVSYTIDTPANNSQLDQDSIYISVDLTEANLANITFEIHNSTGLLNQTVYTTPITTINFSGLPSLNATYYFNVSVSDLASNVVILPTRRVDLLDDQGPAVTIYSPEATAYSYNESIPLNVTVSDRNGVDSCWWNLDESTNQSIGCGAYATFNTSDGLHTLHYYSNDSLGNLATYTVEFIVSTLGPAIFLTNPVDDANLSNLGEFNDFNFTAIDAQGVGSCTLYGNWTGQWHPNQTLFVPWGDSRWTYREEVTIENVGSTTLTDFPVYLNISSREGMRSDYLDLLFVNGSCEENQTLTYIYELEYADSNSAHAWIRIPTFPTPNVTFCMYYGNTGAANNQSSIGVWDSGAESVYHLNDTVGGIATDVYGVYDMNEVGSVSHVEGIVGLASSFTGGNELNDPDGWRDTTATPTTWEAWVRTSSSTADMIIMEDGGASVGIALGMDGGALGFYMTGATGNDVVSPSSGYNDDTWHHVVGVHTTATNYLYIDGQEVGTDTGSATEAGTGNAGIGGASGGVVTDLANNFNGYIDEVRFSDVQRTEDWINQTYQVMADQNSVVSYSPPEAYGNYLTFSVNVSEQGYFDWNVLCNDTVGNESFSAVNYTFALFLSPASPALLGAIPNATDGTGSVSLFWNAVSNAVTYRIYSNEGLSGNFTFLNETQALNWTDDTFSGNRRRFYQIHAWNPTGQNTSGEYFGSHVYTLEHNGNTRNWIGFPTNFTYLTTANDTLWNMTNVTSVTMWNETIQGRVTCNYFSCPDQFSCTETSCNFPLESGRGYEVNLNSSSASPFNWSGAGIVYTTMNLSLVKNTTSFGKNWLTLHANTSFHGAQELIEDISSADALSEWDETLQTSRGILPSPFPWVPYLGTNFTTLIETGYEVSVTADSSWYQS